MSNDLTQTNAMEAVAFCQGHHDTYSDIDPVSFDLSGKSVVITGASKGIGRATAIAFAQAGCSRIAVAARSDLSSLVGELQAAASDAGRPKPTIITIEVDVSSEQSVKALADTIAASFGSIDVLINNAGFSEKWVPLVESEPSEWWKGYEVGIKGTYLCSRYLIPLILKSDTKTIINLSSIGAQMIRPGASAYQSEKFALCRLTEFISADYADEGLVAIAIHPGGVLTETAQVMPSEMHAWLIDTPELAAHFMVWLSKERREWLRGRFLCANWDVKELESKKQDIVSGNKLKFRMVI